MALPTGPLTLADLEAEWRAAVDPTYAEALARALPGEGLEVHEVAWRVFERVSRAIDTTTQQLYVLPWSGESAAPASGEARSAVQLTLARGRLFDHALVLGAGEVLVGEVARDWSLDGGVDVETGRRYVLREAAVFPPGDAGPRLVWADAEGPGPGYDNPLPETLRAFTQVGTALTNIQATVTTGASVVLRSANLPDQFVPEHVGQCVRLTAGSNTGKVARARAFLPPAPGQGSAVVLEETISFEAAVHVGTFAPGELATFSGGQSVTLLGTVSGGMGLRVVGARVAGDLALVASGDVLTGALSGATATVALVARVEQFVAEAATATWEVLGWVEDFAATSTNASSPVGGRLGMLDELGAERAIDRAPGEPDASYRARVAPVADVVSPGAVRRALSRVMGAVPYCLREVGFELLPGFYLDAQDAYDVDVFTLVGVLSSGAFSVPQERVELRAADATLYARGWLGRYTAPNDLLFVRTEGTLPPSLVGATVTGLTTGAVFTCASGAVPTTAVDRRFHRLFDYAEMRAFFLVGVPVAEYDALWGAFTWGDGTVWGVAPEAALLRRAAYDAVDKVRAGGVGFTLYEETVGCEG